MYTGIYGILLDFQTEILRILVNGANLDSKLKPLYKNTCMYNNDFMVKNDESCLSYTVLLDFTGITKKLEGSSAEEVKMKEPVNQQIHRMCLLRVKLMHFVNSLHNYIMTRVSRHFQNSLKYYFYGTKNNNAFISFRADLT